MVVTLPENEYKEELNIFKHSRQYDQGLGTNQVRPGAFSRVVADDGTGDFDSIQEAIDDIYHASELGWGVVYIKEGNYYIKEPISFQKANFAIYGAGPAVKIYPDPNLFSGSTIISIDKNHTTLKDIKVYGGFKDNVNGVTVSGALQVWIFDAKIKEISGASYIKFENGAAEAVVQGTFLDAENAEATTGFEFDDADRCNINGCYVEHIDRGARFHNGSKNNVITGCNFRGGTGGNWQGIFVEDNADTNSVVGNRVFGFETGIEVSGATCDKNLLSMNNIEGNTTAYTDTGTNTEIGHNHY
jgi:hypothetical protein